ncbi:MAG: pyridoxamine 5'-phosphate oxidase family protein, partial [Planktomarina temperata]|nr:pyridoxamine 5'-phosphate oxidase family protein [Planktomarina temperata]
MLNAAAVACIEQVRLGFVAFVTSGGRPSVSPKGSFVVLDERTIAFAEIRSPGTVATLVTVPRWRSILLIVFAARAGGCAGSRKYCA